MPSEATRTTVTACERSPVRLSVTITGEPWVAEYEAESNATIADARPGGTTTETG